MGVLSSQLSTRELVPLCRQMATSYDAGIPITRSFDMLSRTAKSRQVRTVLESMRDDITSGSTLRDAAINQKERLPPFMIHVLAAGESGGRLDVLLKDLATYYEDRLAMERQILGAMVYPAIQLAAAWFLGTFALGLIGQISFDARSTFNIWDYIQSYLQFQFYSMLVLGLVILICIGLARAGVFKWIAGWVTNYVWPLRPVTRKFALARFFRSMSLLIGTGMDIRHCIQNSAAMMTNPYIEHDLLQAVPHINNGATLVEAFAGSKSLTPTAREMLAVGEESGNLDGSLRKVADLHMEEANLAVQVALRLMGIAILLAMGVLVGYIVISFYAKYLGILSSI